MMARAARKQMEDVDLGVIATKVLNTSFKNTELSEVIADEQIDFDGESVIRVSAKVNPAITAKQLGDALGRLRLAFAAEGFDEFVILSVQDASENLSDVED